MMGFEGLCCCAAGNGLHHWRFHFHVAAVVKEIANQADDFHPFLKGFLGLRVDYQVKISLAVPGFDIGEAVKFFRQRSQ